MAKYALRLTKRYLRDLKLARKRGLDESLLNEIIAKLLEGEPLPEKNRDHQLHGDYEGYRECHIMPDWLLIYAKNIDIEIILLSRTGSHSDLFSKKNKPKLKWAFSLFIRSTTPHHPNRNKYYGYAADAK